MILKFINRRASSHYRVRRAAAFKMNKFDLYEIITQKIIDLLNAGIIPWEIPWRTANGSPRNLVTHRPYRGINFWILLCRKDPLPFYLTFEQAKSLGGNIRKGEKSTMVIFWKLLKHEDKAEEEKVIPFLRYYNVFNISQVDGIDEKKIPTADAFDHDFNPITEAESLIADWTDRPLIIRDGNAAFYDPLADAVSIPNPRTFFNDHRYYSTLFHELVHSTGHTKRLGRHAKIKDHKFGSHDYSQEELVAEMGAAYLCGMTGIEQETIENNAAYIKSWIRTFQNDTKVLVLAAAQAQSAVDYIIGIDSDVQCEH